MNNITVDAKATVQALTTTGAVITVAAAPRTAITSWSNLDGPTPREVGTQDVIVRNYFAAGAGVAYITWDGTTPSASNFHVILTLVSGGTLGPDMNRDPCLQVPINDQGNIALHIVPTAACTVALCPGRYVSYNNA